MACCKLGAIRFGQQAYAQAVAYYERGFELARGLPDRRLLDTVRANLGVARAAVNEEAYLEVRRRGVDVFGGGGGGCERVLGMLGAAAGRCRGALRARAWTAGAVASNGAMVAAKLCMGAQSCPVVHCGVLQAANSNVLGLLRFKLNPSSASFQAGRPSTVGGGRF